MADEKKVVKTSDNKVKDTFSNMMANLGLGSTNLSQRGSYHLTRMTWDYGTLNALYRNNWIATGIVDKPAQEMLKNGFEIQSQIEPEQIDKIMAVYTRTRTMLKILDALKWSRLYGGCVLIPLISGQNNLEEELDYETIMPDSYKGCMVIDRWSGISPSLELVTDIDDVDFGEPLYYDISDNVTQKSYRVHHSRVIRFTGRDLPYYERLAEMYWGASEIEHVFTELMKRDNTSANIAYLIFLACIRVYKIQDLGQAITLGDQDAMADVYRTMQAQNQLMCNTGSLVMSQEDDFKMEGYTFTGINDIYESFMLDIAGAAEIPVTKLFGRAPAGMNSTGEADLQNYYDMIQEKQESHLRQPLEKLMKIITMSAIGSIPDDWELVFSPIRRNTDEEQADLAQKSFQPIMEAFQSGLIDKATALKELRQQQKRVSMWSNITDEMIDEAVEEDKKKKAEEEEMAKNLQESENEVDDEEEDKPKKGLAKLFGKR